MNEPMAMQECDIYQMLLQQLVDAQTHLVLVLENEKAVASNHAFNTFFDLDNISQFAREIGALEYRFVPHDTYFHAGKMDEGETWFEAIERCDPSERLVSMLSAKMEPHAFEVVALDPVGVYRIVVFHDVTKTLIKRILIENDASLDKVSGAYSKEYFIHTASSLSDAATFNERLIALTHIRFSAELPIECEADFLQAIVARIKGAIRSEDMLVQWNQRELLVAYMLQDPTGTDPMLNKLRRLLDVWTYEGCKSFEYRLQSVTQNPGEPIRELLKRLG